MNANELIRQNLMGGPGLDAYAYQATLYCVDCAAEITEDVAADLAPKLASTDDPLFSDSETLPQPVFFGESDTAQHCDKCGAYLYGPEESVEQK